MLQKAFIKKVLAENSGYPGFLFGNSTGAAIVLKVSYVLFSGRSNYILINFWNQIQGRTLSIDQALICNFFFHEYIWRQY